MRDVWLRISLAALISAMGILGTYLWSQSNRKVTRPKGEEPIARIVIANHEVQQRPAGRLIWQPSLKSQDLYNGEAVRTGANGSARIEFIGKDAYADLESDTVIEIEDSGNGLNLDFLVGNLSIHTNDSAKSQITVQSGQQKVELKNSDVAIAKAAAAAPIDLDVIKGDAHVVSGKDTVKDEKPKLKITNPKRGSVVYADPEKGATLTIEWQPFTKEPGYEVYLESGTNRNALQRDSSVAAAPLQEGRLKARIDVGKIFFRLVARGKSEVASMTSMIEVKPKLAPGPLTPAANANIFLKDAASKIDFTWTNDGELVDLRLDIANQPDLKKTYISQQSELPTSLPIQLPREKATYYWRVSGRLPDTQVVISSPVRKFNVSLVDTPAPTPTPTPVRALQAPQLVSPAALEKIPFLKMRLDGEWLTWAPVAGAHKYELTLAGEKKYLETTADTRINVSKLPSGNYQWSVVAIAEPEKSEEPSEEKPGAQPAARKSPPSETRTFSVGENPVLKWSDGLLNTKLTYKTEKPTANLSWESGPGQPKKWRVRVTQKRDSAANADWQEVTTPTLSVTLEGPGLYFAEAESLDESGAPISRTALRSIRMEQAPPLSPPDFSAAVANPIRAHADGSADIAWRPVAEAKQYILTVKSKDGEKVQSMTVDSPNAKVKGLKSGDYTVSLQTVDSIGRTGAEGKGRALSVPEFSAVRAPKIKAVKVK